MSDLFSDEVTTISNVKGLLYFSVFKTAALLGVYMYLKDVCLSADFRVTETSIDPKSTVS